LGEKGFSKRVFAIHAVYTHHDVKYLVNLGGRRHQFLSFRFIRFQSKRIVDKAAAIVQNNYMILYIEGL